MSTGLSGSPHGENVSRGWRELAPSGRLANCGAKQHIESVGTKVTALQSGHLKAAFGKQKFAETPQLRPFRTSDLDDAYRLDQVCFPPGVAYSRSELGAYARMRNAKTWVAERGKTSLAGFVIACRDGRAQGHIITVDVAPDWRRRGLGSILMDAAENWICEQGGEVVYLETAEDNLPAQSFYLKRGYSNLRRIEDYYANGAAAWLMAKTLGAKELADAVSRTQ